MDAVKTGTGGDPLTGIVIGAFYTVYNQLGYGFLESVYRRALTHELQKQNLRVECEHGIDVWYDGVIVGQFRADLLVDRRLIVETKTSQVLVDADWKQLLNYLKPRISSSAFCFTLVQKRLSGGSPSTMPRKGTCHDPLNEAQTKSAKIAVPMCVHLRCRFSGNPAVPLSGHRLTSRPRRTLIAARH